MDVISFVSHCPTCEHLVRTYAQCCPPPFTTVVSQWWSATKHVERRRNFVRGLVPMSLYRKLTTPPSGRRRTVHCHDLKLALTARASLLLNPLSRALEWINDPPPSPRQPPHQLKPMEAPLVALQHVTHRPSAPPPHLPCSPPPPRQGRTQASKTPPPPSCPSGSALHR